MSQSGKVNKASDARTEREGIATEHLIGLPPPLAELAPTDANEDMGCAPDAADSRTHEVPLECHPVVAMEDIFPAYRGTPIGELLAYHNLGAPFQQHPKPELLIGMCMDYRMWLRIPPDFAYILRVGGANLRGLEFHISVAVANGVNTVCVIGHDQCAMSGVASRDREFVRHLVEKGGWGHREAWNHFSAHAAHVDIGDVIDFLKWETVHLRRRYPQVFVVPLFYSVSERALYQLDESELK